jgi:hypothetical protein
MLCQYTPGILILLYLPDHGAKARPFQAKTEAPDTRE